MTRFHKDYVVCPHCAGEESVVIWERVHVQEDPDLKERILKKELQAFECSNCGEEVIMAEPFLYVDAAAKQLFYYCPQNKDLLENNRDLVETMPLPDAAELLGTSASEATRYHLRLVTSYNDLIEKIHLYSAGLDDRLMELVKLAMRTRLAEAEGKVLNEIYFLSEQGSDGNSGNESVEDVGYDMNFGGTHAKAATMTEPDHDAGEGFLFQVLEEESGWNSFESTREPYDNALKQLLALLPADQGWQLIDLQWALATVQDLSKPQ